MSSRILTSDVIGIDAFRQNPVQILSKAKMGTLAVFADNGPAFYAITHERLAELLALEEKSSHILNDVTLEPEFYNPPVRQQSIPIPGGKFAMYPGWKPDADFQQMAALWGFALLQPVTDEELSTFITYWQAEGKYFHHVQWQQKLARSVQIGRASGNSGTARRDINDISSFDYSNTLPGFRGTK